MTFTSCTGNVSIFKLPFGLPHLRELLDLTAPFLSKRCILNAVHAHGRPRGDQVPDSADIDNAKIQREWMMALTCNLITEDARCSVSNPDYVHHLAAVEPPAHFAIDVPPKTHVRHV